MAGLRMSCSATSLATSSAATCGEFYVIILFIINNNNGGVAHQLQRHLLGHLLRRHLRVFFIIIIIYN